MAQHEREHEDGSAVNEMGHEMGKRKDKDHDNGDGDGKTKFPRIDLSFPVGIDPQLVLDEVARVYFNNPEMRQKYPHLFLLTHDGTGTYRANRSAIFRALIEERMGMTLEEIAAQAEKRLAKQRKLKK